MLQRSEMNRHKQLAQVKFVVLRGGMGKAWCTLRQLGI